MAAPEQDSRTHVLVVDDEPALLRTLVMNLIQRGYQVSSATNGRGALELLGALSPDLMVLDLGLPDVEGLEVIRRVRAHNRVLPILILSARSSSQEKVAALDAGANDYVTKPFDMNELVARLRAAVRRIDVGEPQSVVDLGLVTVDLAARMVRRNDLTVEDADRPDSIVHLTPTEWRMLDALLRRPGMLITPDELLVAMRGDPLHTDGSYLRIYMQQLRRKLEAEPSRPRHLLTEPGLGYRYMP
jgi:two-component system, OmpR family, KDP operon response regulator KdpE